MTDFTFTRNPSTKISIAIEAAGLTPADNQVILIGRRAANTAAVKEEGTIDTTGSTGAGLDGTFFNLPEGPDAVANGVAFWVDTDNSGTTIPAGASTIVSGGGRAVEITTILAGDAPAAIATKIATAILADAGFDLGSEVVNLISYRNAVAGVSADGADGAQATGFVFAITTQGAAEAEVGTAVTGEPIVIENLGGDSSTLLAEVDAKFGAGSEIGEMVIAGSEAVQFSDLDPLLLPPVKAIPLADDETDATTVLANNSSIPMPFVALSFPLTDSTNLTALKDHVVAISKSDRGINGQFGSFGFMHSDQDLATVTPIAEGVARQEMVLAWLRDLAVTKKNKTHEVAAATCVLMAANIAPFKPLNGIKIGKLEAPVNTADHHTPGDAGTVAVGLDSGLVPLTVDEGGNILFSRTVTAARRVTGVPDANYFDVQDWQVLYLYRKNAFVLSQQSRYKNAKGTNQKAESFLSELIAIAKQLEDLEMLQFVQELADQFTFRRDSSNRSAFIFEVPLNVVPGFHNKGIGLTGTTQFDLIAI